MDLNNKKIQLGLTGAVFAAVFALSSCAIMPTWSVYSAKMEGEAELAKATQNRQIIVQEAQAQKEAEIARAQGTAEANKIIGESLKNNPSYLRWLYITGMSKEVNKTIVYLPNPEMAPQLETGRVGTDNTTGKLP